VTLTEQLAGWASRLTLDEIPPRVVECAKSQVLSQLAAARASQEHPLGRRVTEAFGPAWQPGDPKQTAYVLAALTMCLDFDDTMYAGHVSHSTVNVSLAYASALGLDGQALLTAVIAANECAARMTAAATLGQLRGQTAVHTHLAGAVAARSRSEAASVEQWVQAWGIALAMASWPLTRAFMGSDAKVLTASVPVRVGLDACDAAAAGLRGAPDILEHPDGFLARVASVPVPEAVTRGLGERWHTETLSFKVYPGCAYIDAAVDCAVALHRELPSLRPEEVMEIRVHGSIFTVGMELRSAPFVVGPDSSVSALNFSVGYNVATALLTGALTPADFARERLGDQRRWALAAKVRVEHDWALTRRAVLATAPLGEALRQAGDRAADWLRTMGGVQAADLLVNAGAPADSFEDAEKAIGARVEVHLTDGRVLAHARDIPLGAAGPQTRRAHAALMRDKFLACGGTAETADALAELERLPETEVARTMATALVPRSSV
jgi:2-methylcitrate dehydratase PrpD